MRTVWPSAKNVQVPVSIADADRVVMRVRPAFRRRFGGQFPVDIKIVRVQQELPAVHGKHHHVIRTIRQRIAEAGDWGLTNFGETPYIDEQNAPQAGAAPCELPMTAILARRKQGPSERAGDAQWRGVGWQDTRGLFGLPQIALNTLQECAQLSLERVWFVGVATRNRLACCRFWAGRA